VCLALAFVTGTAAWRLGKRRLVHAETRVPLKLDTEDRRRQYAKRGLIVLVGVFRPNRGSRAESLPVEERLALAERGDYTGLDLPNSNLALAIAAVALYQDKALLADVHG